MVAIRRYSKSKKKINWSNTQQKPCCQINKNLKCNFDPFGEQGAFSVYRLNLKRIFYAWYIALYYHNLAECSVSSHNDKLSIQIGKNHQMIRNQLTIIGGAEYFHDFIPQSKQQENIKWWRSIDSTLFCKEIIGRSLSIDIFHNQWK